MILNKVQGLYQGTETLQEERKAHFTLRTANMTERFREVLANTSALDLIQKGRSLYVVSKDATVEETLQVMARNGVVSVPVKETEEDTVFNNFVDTSDILAFLASLCKDTNSLVQLKVETFTNQKVGDIVSTFRLIFLLYARASRFADIMNCSIDTVWCRHVQQGSLYFRGRNGKCCQGVGALLRGHSPSGFERQRRKYH